MIEIASFLGNYDRNLIKQYAGFLDSRSVPASQYRVSPLSDDPADEKVVIYYQQEMFGALACKSRLILNTDKSVRSSDTGLSSALNLMALLFDDPSTMNKIDQAPSLPADLVLAYFAIPQETMRPKVASYMSGEYLARGATGFVYYTVDTHGEIVVEAQSDDLAMVAFQLWASRRAEETRLYSRLAQFSLN